MIRAEKIKANNNINHIKMFCHPSINGDNNVAVVPANTLRSFVL